MHGPHHVLKTCLGLSPTCIVCALLWVTTVDSRSQAWVRSTLGAGEHNAGKDLARQRVRKVHQTAVAVDDKGQARGSDDLRNGESDSDSMTLRDLLDVWSDDSPPNGTFVPAGEDLANGTANETVETTGTTTPYVPETTTTPFTTTTEEWMQAFHAEHVQYTWSEMEDGADKMCYAHYLNRTDAADAAACAKECFKQPPCLKFSFGEHSGCRISHPDVNYRGPDNVPKDEQCYASSLNRNISTSAVLYRLVFFSAVDIGAACVDSYKSVEKAKSKAACAHACKATEGCVTFTAEPNCDVGCRLSVEHDCEDGKACSKDHQCLISTSHGCVKYKLTLHAD